MNLHKKHPAKTMEYFNRWLRELAEARVAGTLEETRKRISKERSSSTIDPMATFIGRFTPSVRKTGSEACKDYIWLKYADNGPPRDAEQFETTVNAIIPHIAVPPRLLEFFRAKSVEPQNDWLEWERKYRLANARQQALLDIEAAMCSFFPFIDPAARTIFDDALGASGPVIMLTSHLGFSRLRAFMGKHFARNVVSAGVPAGASTVIARNVALNSMRCLMEGGVLFIAPDGPNGTNRMSINIGGVQIDISTGASRMAYEAGARVVYMNVEFGGGLFRPYFRFGPAREPTEGRSSFISRVNEFYADCLREGLWSDPERLVVPFQFYPLLSQH